MLFPGLSDGQREGLALPWLVWAALLFGGFFFGKLNAEGTHRIPRWARMASSFTLVIVAWGWFEFAIFSREYILLIAIGMTLGFIGDLFMAQLVPLKDYVLGGIGSFGLGHIAYIIAFISFGNEHNLFLENETTRWIAVFVWWLIALAGWYIVVFRGQKHTFLHYAALPYALLLASTAGLATGLAIHNAAFIPLAIGTALFLLSDLILAAQLFNGLHFKMIGDVVWLTYGPAQMLIVYSVASASVMGKFVGG
ncbi:MAG: lysoplasmalogenase [Chloroflexota bacterium]